MNTLPECIRAAAASGDKEALVFGKERLTYGDLDRRSSRLAGLLRRAGVRKGDRVGLVMPNCVESVVAFTAILKMGAVEVGFHTETSVETLARAFREVDASLVICGRTPVSKMKDLIRALPSLNWVIDGIPPDVGTSEGAFIDLAEAEREHDDFDFGLDDPSTPLVQFTSGSTGYPRGVVLTQAGFLAASRARNEFLHLDRDDRILDILKLSHSCGKSLLFDAFYLGACLVLGKGLVPPSTFIKTVVGEKVSLITGPPYLFEVLLKIRNDVRVMEALKNSLRFLEVGMAHPSVRLLKDLRSVFPWTSLVNRYGLTENAGAASLQVHAPEDGDRFGTMGRGCSVMQLDLVDESTGLPSDSNAGTIRLRGEALMLGYWDEWSAGCRTDYAVSGFVTGDRAERDSEGFFYFKGRGDHLLKVCGERIAPEEIEEAVCALPGIAEVTVFGVEDDLTGDRIVCLYRAAGEVAPESVKAHCARSLPSYKVPAVVLVSSEPIPRTATGKISRRLAREAYLSGGYTG